MESGKGAEPDRNLTVRKLEITDKSKGFIELLQQLTTCDSVSDKEFEIRFQELCAYGDDHLICVVENEDSGKIIATGCVFVERKFIRNCGKVGHIEDVVVDSSSRGLQLGKKVIDFLTEHAQSRGCYKVILDCSGENRGFYEKCGFKQKEVQMVSFWSSILAEDITAQSMDISDSGSHQTSKSFSADDTPDCILLEIFLHLPVKSIFRFKSVCKHWFSLIIDPSFAQLYTAATIEKDDQQPLPWALLFCYMNCYSGKIPPNYLGIHSAFKLCNSEYPNLLLSAQFPPLDQESLRLLACDSGLLLCCITQNWQEFYFVCNPLTVQWTSLPRRPQLHKWVSIGFVVEPEDGSFQIIRIAEFSGSSNVLELETYSSKEGNWIEEKLTCPSPVCLYITHRQAVAYKGVLHWREYNNRVIAYDPRGDSKECRLIDMPRDRDRDGQGVLRVSGGGLYYFEVCARLYARGFDMWELKDYEAGEWHLLYRISVDDILSADPRVLRVVRCDRYTLHPLALHPFDSDVVYLSCGARMASCNLRTRMLDFAQNERPPTSDLDSWTVVPFVLPLWPTPVPRPQLK